MILRIHLGLAIALSASAAGGHDRLRLNHIQTIGSHNSYHLAPRSLLLVPFASTMQEWRYEHAPLATQLERQNVRQVELDVFADPEGGLYARPFALRSGERTDPALLEPGFKVLHVQDLDFRSTCPTLRACLSQIRSWSAEHPGHIPILVLVEVMDGPIADPLGLGFTRPIPTTPSALDELDRELREALGDTLLEPDEIRGDSETLRDAIGRRGWPLLEDVRGRILCALDNGGRVRRMYLRGHPSLEGRTMFVDSRPEDDHAGFARINDPVRDGDRIRAFVAAGLLVRTRADAGLKEALRNDPTRRDAALASGAHFVSTDFPVEDADLAPGYSVRLPGGSVARVNPVSGPKGLRCEPIDEPRDRDDG